MVRLVIPLIIAAALAACGGGGSAPGRTLAIEASEFNFAPAQVELKVGERIRLRVTNKGTLDHDLNIKDLPTTGAVESHSTGEHAGEHDSRLHVFTTVGKSGTLDFTPGAAGTYEVFCSVAGHREAGMVAKIVVR